MSVQSLEFAEAVRSFALRRARQFETEGEELDDQADD
jgi:hypothetical protein